MHDRPSLRLPARRATFQPGEEAAFHLSSASLGRAEAALLRVRCADPDPAGPGLRFEQPGCPLDGPVALRHQPLRPGSCAVVPDAPALRRAGPQTILSRWRDDAREGWRLGLDAEGRLEFVVGAAGQVWRAVAPVALLEREWVFVGGTIDPASGCISVTQSSLDPQAGRDRSATASAAGPRGIAWPDATALVIGAHAQEAGDEPRTAGHLDGKVDRPRLHTSAMDADALRALCETINPNPANPDLLAAWDFSRDIPTETVSDISINRLDGTLRQMPARAMTGANWDGRTAQWTEAPWQYGAIHFHSDDMADAGWTSDLRLTIPLEWRSGFYILRLRAREGTDDPVESFVAFFVRAPLGRATAPVAFVASTATFLTYANSALRLDQVHAESMLEGLITLSRDDVYLQEHRVAPRVFQPADARRVRRLPARRRARARSPSGEPSGLWRSSGRSPQRLVGVGFAAQVFDHSSPYRWLDGAQDPRVAWLVDGLDLAAPLGDFGLRGGAGGGPGRAHARLAARPRVARDRGPARLRRHPHAGGAAHAAPRRHGRPERARASRPRLLPDGAGRPVFSTGSIAWACALSHAGYDNPVSRVTGNVLRRFLDPAPFEGFPA